MSHHNKPKVYVNQLYPDHTQPFHATLDDPAPIFTAPAFVNGEIKKVNLEDYRGSWVILFFYGSDFTFV